MCNQQETIEEHERSLDVKNPRDVIDAFLIEKRESKDQTSKYYYL